MNNFRIIPRLQDLFVFRQAKLSDQSEIMKFIDDFWKPNHILSKDPHFFKYEHVNGSDINFFLAINKKSKSIFLTLNAAKSDRLII